MINSESLAFRLKPDVIKEKTEQPRLFEIVLPGPTKLPATVVKTKLTLEQVLGPVDYVETFLIRKNKEFSYYSVTTKSKEQIFTAVLGSQAFNINLGFSNILFVSDSADIRAPMLILNNSHQVSGQSLCS